MMGIAPGRREGVLVNGTVVVMVSFTVKIHQTHLSHIGCTLNLICTRSETVKEPIIPIGLSIALQDSFLKRNPCMKYTGPTQPSYLLFLPA